MIIKNKDIFTENGFVLTSEQAYATNANLGSVDKAKNWYKITKKEYQEILKKEAILYADFTI